MAWSQDVVINDATVTSALQNHGNVAMTNNWAIVGSASPEGGTRVGSALVYKYENDTWVQKQRLTAEGDIKNYMDFGYSVSITDSFAFVSAPSSKTQSQKGEVYVFKLNNGTWTRHSKLEPEASANVENGNMFGYDIEVSNTTLIIGCPWYDYGGTTENGGKTESGAFFVSDYDSNTDTWSTPALNTDYSSLVTQGMSIGRSVSIYGDYACIGTGGQYGKVFNYKRVDGTWQSMGDDYVFDGNDCAVGENYLLIGFYFSTQTGGGFNSGQAHIYEKTANGWENPVALTGPGGIIDAFGDGLDINDSYAIVGAYTHTISDKTGGVCIFQRGEGNTWTNVTSGNGGVIEGSEIDYTMVGRSVAMTPNGSYFIANQQPSGSSKDVGIIFKNASITHSTDTITHPTAANQTSSAETSGNTSTSFTGVSYNGVRDTLVTTPSNFASSAYNKKNNTTFIIDRGSGILKVTNHTDDTTFELAFTEKSDSSSPNYNNNYSFVYSVATFDDFVLIGAIGYKYNANVAGVGTAYILKYNNGWPQTVTTNDRLFPDTISADDSSLASLLYGSNVQLFNHDSKTWAAVSTSSGDVSGKAIFLFTKDSNDTWSFNHKVEDPANNAGWPLYWNFAGDMLYTRGQQSTSNLFYKYNSSSGVWEYSFTPSITFDYGYVSNNYFMGIPTSVDNTVQIYKINDTKTDLVAETVFSAVTSVQPGFLSLSISDTGAIYTDNRKSSGIKILKNDNDTWSEVSITYNEADPNLDGIISRPLVTNNNISYIEANPLGFPIYQPHAFIVLKLDGVAETTETTEDNTQSAAEIALAEEQQAAETEATSSGISTADINIFKTGTFTVSNGKSTLDASRKTKLLQLMQGASNATEKRSKRRAALKLLFSQTADLKRLVVPKADLDLPNTFTKTNAIVVKAGETFNINDLESDEGFYSVLDDGETFEIVTQNTTLTFTRNDDINGTELYEVSALDWTDIVINSDNVTGTFSDSNTSGNLKVNDKVTIDGRIFIIGSIADGGDSGGSAGDPYVFPIKSSIPVKLPNKNAFYRMFEQGDNYINVEVGRCTDEHKNRMLDYAKKLTPVTHNIVMDGYFYQNVFISAEGHQLAIDYNTKKGNCDDEAMKFFKIKQSKKLFDCGEFYEDANCWSITWDTKENKKIQVELMFFPNPHIENGINIIPSTFKKSTGLIVDNYKPKLMELPSLTKEKFNKLHHRLAKSKNRYQNLSIKSKNEKWHFN